MSEDAFAQAAASAKEGETVWTYELYLPIVHGVISAPRGDRDAALSAAMDDALGQFGPSLAAATYTLREVSP